MRVLILWLALMAVAFADQPLVLVIDPGHGDRQVGAVPADPGTGADTPYGRACECVFTWDTAMRLKTVAEAAGAKVVLTLIDPAGDYAPKPWGPQEFPTPDQFVFKILADVPEPATIDQALMSRVATGNRIYRQYSTDHRVVFVSLHFDSTSPSLAGISFYYPPGTHASLVDALETDIRNAGRQRIDLSTGREFQLSQPHDYAVLGGSDNPAACLVELGNIRSQDDQGKNPDLWRMRNPQVRQEYAQLIFHAIQQPPRPPMRRRWLLLLVLLLVAGGAIAVLTLKPRSDAPRPAALPPPSTVEPPT